VFDFDGDGRSEVVYTDESSVHVFAGEDGSDRFTLAHRSATGLENPVVADVDADGHTEIVAVGQQLPSIEVFRDVDRNWVASRAIWNQHAYHVTNVNDDGTIPRTSAAMTNWTTPGLNNFRQNVQGSPVPGATPDLTSRGIGVECAGDSVTLSANVCNRGTESVGAGMSVGFYAGDPDAGGMLVCRGFTDRVLDPGTCAPVECTGTADIGGVTIFAVADDEGTEGECHEGNNRAVLDGAMCLG
jgi:hypothetical protein